jgi:branched-chain amino acid transport system ATP-binding protein
LLAADDELQEGVSVGILEIEKLSKHFGGLAAIDEVDLEIHESEIRGIIGPNGAGKTTLFNVISGFLLPTKGRVIFEGKEITKLPVHSRVERGIARTFQLTNLFMELTAFENAYIGYHRNYKQGLVSQFLHTGAARSEYERCYQKTAEILQFMGLSSFQDTLARNLSFGHQRVLGVCIALATKPSLLMLDEPVAGMNLEETMIMVELIRKIRDEGITILLVEHDMAAVMNLCERISVLDYGRKIAEGPPEEIKKDKKVIEAYLGSEENNRYHA